MAISHDRKQFAARLSNGRTSRWENILRRCSRLVTLPFCTAWWALGQLQERIVQCDHLENSLDQERIRSVALQHDYDAFKKEHRVSGDLGVLQEAVNALQKQLSPKQGK